MQSDFFSYRNAAEISLKSNSSDCLEYCIKKVIDNSANLKSDSFISSVYNFQSCVTSQYKTSMLNNTEGYYFNMLFSRLSFNSLNNTKSFLTLMYAIIGADLGDKRNKAMNISKDITSIQPVTDSTVWELLEKILVWIANPLGSSMQLILHPLRDMIWKWYFSDDEVSVISSLCLLNIFFRRFYVLLVPAFESFQSLLLHSIQKPQIKIREQAIKVLKSALSILGSPNDGTIKDLFNQFRIQIETNYSPTLVDSVVRVFEHTVNCFSIMQFTKKMFDKINPNDPASFVLIPFIYKCTPSLFTIDDLKKLFEIFQNIIVQVPSKKKLVYRAIGTLGFQLTEEIRCNIRNKTDFFLSKIIFDTPEAAYAFLSLFNPNEGKYMEKFDSIKDLPISIYSARGMRSFISRYPKYGYNLRCHIIGAFNIHILIVSDDDKIAKAFHILRMFTFNREEVNETTMDQYSSLLQNSSPTIREECAHFLVKQQSNFPNVVYRLVAFISFETNPELREAIFSRIEIECDSQGIIAPLLSLLGDRQNAIVYRALNLLCSIKSATPFVNEFASDLINRIEKSSELEKHYINCLLVLANCDFAYIKPYSVLICNYILKFNHQTSSSLKLIALLINKVDFEPIIPRLSKIIFKLLNKSVSNNKTNSVLDLFSLLITSKNFREIVNNNKEDILNNVVDIFSATNSKSIKTKIINIFSQIGLVKSNITRKLFTRHVKNKMLFTRTNEFSPSLSNYATLFTISSVIEIVESDGMIGLQEKALETLLVILEKFKDFQEIVNNEILDRVYMIIKKANQTTVPVILQNVPKLVRTFDHKACIFIPKIIELIFDNWGKIDMVTLLKDIEWITYKLQSDVAPYATKLLSLFVPCLSYANPNEANDIFIAIACFGNLIAPVDTMVMDNILPWIEGHIHNTKIEENALEKFAEILKNFSTKKFIGRIYRTMKMTAKENEEIVPKVVEVLTVLAVQNRDFPKAFHPEIIGIFELSKYDDFWKLCAMQISDSPIPDNLISKYNCPQINKLFQEIDCKESIEYTLPSFFMPDTQWDALEWNRWVNTFINLFIEKSPSESITSCIEICNRNHNVRSALFPVSFALCISKVKDATQLYTVLQTSLQAKGIPLYARSLFLSAIEILIMHNLEVRVPEDVIISASVATGNLNLALNFYEKKYIKNGDIIDLLKINMKMGKNSLVKYLIKPKTYREAEIIGDWEKAVEFVDHNDKEKRENCLEKMNMFVTLQKIGCEEKRRANVALINNLPQFKEYATSDFQKAIISLAKGDGENAFKIANSIRSNLIQNILGIHNYDIAEITTEISNASVIIDLENAAKILLLRDKLIKSSPYEKKLCNEGIKRIITMWNDKFELCEPVYRFVSIIIRSIVLPVEEKADSLIYFLRKFNNDKRAGELNEIALRELKSISSIKYQLISARLKENYDDFKSIIDQNKVEEYWRNELGEWMERSGEYMIAKDYIKKNTIQWAKCSIMVYNKTNDFSLLSDAINIFMSSGEIIYIISLLQEEPKRESISKILDKVINNIDILKWSYYLPFIVSRLNIQIFKKIFYLILKKNEAKTIYSILPFLIENNKEQLDGYPISKFYIKFANECIKLSNIYHEKIISASARFVKSHSIKEMISLYNNVEESSIYRQFVAMNHGFDMCRKSVINYTKTNSHRDILASVEIHDKLLSNIDFPVEYTLSSISSINSLFDKADIVEPFGQDIIKQCGTVTVNENYSKTIRMITKSGEISKIVIRNRDGCFFDQRVCFFMKEVADLFRLLNRHYVIPPLVQILPLTKNISLEKGDTSISIFESIKTNGKKFNISPNELDSNGLEKFIAKTSSSIANYDQKRNQYRGSLATKCVTGYILGVEKRYLTNIMICSETSRVYNVFYTNCFNESDNSIPFRFTKTLLNVLDISGKYGVIKGTMKKSLIDIRRNSDILFATLKASIMDDNLNWTEKKENAISRLCTILHKSDKDIDDEVNELIKNASSKENIDKMSEEWSPWL